MKEWYYLVRETETLERIIEMIKGNELFKKVIIGAGVFDIVGGFFFIIFNGFLDSTTETTIYPFMVGMFLLCLGLIQLKCASNVVRYFSIIGIATLSRVLYFIIVSVFLITSEPLASTYILTAIADLVWVILIGVLAYMHEGISLKDLIK